MKCVLSNPNFRISIPLGWGTIPLSNHWFYINANFEIWQAFRITDVGGYANLPRDVRQKFYFLRMYFPQPMMIMKDDGTY